MKAIEKRLQQLEAEQGRKNLPPMHIVQYTVRYGDDVEAKRAEAEAEFRRLNPDWEGPLDADDGPICLIELVSVAAENGNPKHPEWLASLDR